jgi:DNA polymerase III delta subunit
LDLLRSFRKKYPEGTVVILRADERAESFPSDLSIAVSVDLFASVRLVDVRDACDVSDDIQKKIVAILRESPSASVLFSGSAPSSAKSPLFIYLRKHAGKTERFERLSSSEAEAFAIAEAVSVVPTISFSRDALSRIVSACDSDSARISSEAVKLAVYAGGGRVSASDVDLFLRSDPREKVFDALDALMAGNRKKALDMLLREAGSDSGGARKLFGLLAWQMRELFKVRGEYDKGLRRADDIAHSVGMKPFVVGKLLARMDAFPSRRLKAGFSLLADFDAEMNSGRIDPELALTLFVEKL